MTCLAKIFVFNLIRDHLKNPMSVATMSRYTKKASLRLSPEKLREKNSGSKGLNKMKIYKFI